MARDPQRREPFDELDHDEEADDDDGRQLHDGDEDPEEDEGADPRSWREDEVRAEHAGDRARRAEHRRRRHEALPDRGDDPAEQIEEQVRCAPEPRLDVVAEDPEIEHVADDVQPSAVQEHVRHERHERRERPCAGGQVAAEARPVERVAIEERAERARRPLQVEDVDPDDDVHEEQQPVHRGRALGRLGVGERDHRDRSVATIFDPCAVYAMRCPSETKNAVAGGRSFGRSNRATSRPSRVSCTMRFPAASST